MYCKANIWTGYIVVANPNATVTGMSNAGSVLIYDPTSLAVVAVVSGESVDDHFGSGTLLPLLSTSNFIVTSPLDDRATPTASSSPSPTPSVSSTPTTTTAPSPSLTRTQSVTPSVFATPSPTRTSSSSSTNTVTSTLSPVPTGTPTTATPTRTMTPSPYPSPTPAPQTTIPLILNEPMTIILQTEDDDPTIILISGDDTTANLTVSCLFCMLTTWLTRL